MEEAFIYRARKNVWKWLFFILLGINVALVLTVFWFVGIPQELPEQDKTNTEQQQAYMMISSSKESLNKLISNYIQEIQSDDTIDYEVVLTDYIEVYTALPVFSQELQLKMTFEPIPLENGDLVLKQQSMELGSMQLPVSYVLNFIKKQENYPDWMEIDSKNKEIYVSLSEVEFFENVTLQVNEFDLEKDDISFKILIPEK